MLFIEIFLALHVSFNIQSFMCTLPQKMSSRLIHDQRSWSAENCVQDTGYDIK